MFSHSLRFAGRILGIGRVPAASIVLAAMFAAPALAAIELRVEGRPSSEPIEAYVKITDADGDPVPSLDESDFTILIDGEPITIAADDITLPPSLDPDQRVSVVFVLDYSPSVVNQYAADLQNT